MVDIRKKMNIMRKIGEQDILSEIFNFLAGSAANLDISHYP